MPNLWGVQVRKEVLVVYELWRWLEQEITAYHKLGGTDKSIDYF